MKTSENITNLTKALFAFHGKVSKRKEELQTTLILKRTTQTSSSISLTLINPILQDCGIFVTQHPHDDMY
jgi:hypothetical protein